MLMGLIDESVDFEESLSVKPSVRDSPRVVVKQGVRSSVGETIFPAVEYSER